MISLLAFLIDTKVIQSDSTRKKMHSTHRSQIVDVNIKPELLFNTLEMNIV